MFSRGMILWGRAAGTAGQGLLLVLIEPLSGFYSPLWGQDFGVFFRLVPIKLMSWGNSATQ